LIPIIRIAQPKILEKNSGCWLSQLKALSSDPVKNKKDIKKVQNKYRHIKVKDALVEMFHGKCAYCESKITTVTYGAIEHFFPKSVYVDLTYEWNNLLLSCDLCNDAKHKGMKFPLDSDGNALLIDPTDGITDPTLHLKFVWDDVAGLASVYGRDDRGKTVETIFDLNGLRGRQELINHRSRYVKRLFALLRLAQMGDSEAVSLLQESCDPSAEYSAFALVNIHPYILALSS
jgi:HNH endonuclease